MEEALGCRVMAIQFGFNKPKHVGSNVFHMEKGIKDISAVVTKAETVDVLKIEK